MVSKWWAGAGLLSLSFVFGGAVNFPSHSAIHYSLINLPKCTDNRGRDVEYVPVTGQDLKDHDVSIATSYRANYFQPYIAYDRDLLPNTPPEFQEMVFSHECAHHELGHMDLDVAEFQKNKARYEKDADCTGLERLRRQKNYGRREIAVIDDANKTLNQNTREGKNETGPPYPDRQAILTACLNPA